MKKILTLVATVVMILSVSAPAFAMEGTSGRDYGKHHATHAQDMDGFTADMNPGTKHQGFSGWTGM